MWTKACFVGKLNVDGGKNGAGFAQTYNLNWLQMWKSTFQHLVKMEELKPFHGNCVVVGQHKKIDQLDADVDNYDGGGEDVAAAVDDNKMQLFLEYVVVCIVCIVSCLVATLS